MDYFDITLAVVFLVGIFCFWYFSYRNWHLGEGMVLARNRDDGTVWVVSRLVCSPSGRAGVQNQSKVLSRNGQNALFKSDEEFLAWTKGNNGKKAIWEFEGGLIVELNPEMIRTKIPVYWVPGSSFQKKIRENENNPFLKKGSGFCRKTEQFFKTFSIGKNVLGSQSV